MSWCCMSAAKHAGQQLRHLHTVPSLATYPADANSLAREALKLAYRNETPEPRYLQGLPLLVAHHSPVRSTFRLLNGTMYDKRPGANQNAQPIQSLVPVQPPASQASAPAPQPVQAQAAPATYSLWSNQLHRSSNRHQSRPVKTKWWAMQPAKRQGGCSSCWGPQAKIVLPRLVG